VAAIDLYCQREAGARRTAIDGDGAGAAHAVFATDMRAGHPDLLPEEIRQ
jgi:hypothetical protein